MKITEKARLFSKYFHGSRFRSLYQRLFSLNGPPTHLAFSFALGVFLSFTPFYGLHSLGAVGLAYLLRLNLMAVMIGAWVNNPVTVPFVYGGSYYIGSLLIGKADITGELSWRHLNTDILGKIFLQLLTGCTITGLVAGFIAFWCCHHSIVLFRRNQRPSNIKIR